MKTYEYKLHYLRLKVGSTREEQIVDALNEFGADGWRLNRMFGEISLRSLSSWKGGVNFLLERETDN